MSTARVWSPLQLDTKKYAMATKVRWPYVKQTTIKNSKYVDIFFRWGNQQHLFIRSGSALVRLFNCLFYVQSSKFCSLLEVKWHVIGCINYGVLVGLCSELLKRLSFYIHLAYGNSKNVSPRGNRTHELSILRHCRYR